MTPTPRIPAVVAAATCLAALTGCFALGGGETLLASGAVAGAAYMIGQEADVEDWHNVKPRKAAQVTPTEMLHQVGFAAGDASLLGVEMAALDDFLRRVRPTEVDEIGVHADPTPLARRRAEAVVGYLAHGGVPAYLAVDPARPASGGVSVRVRRHLVTLPACPDWSDEPGNIFSNGPGANWGCATASNLGLMVADPRHLVAGRPMGPGDGGYMAASITRYRAGETKPIAILNTGKTYTFSKTDGDQ